jgi:hypothetical protein
LNDSEQVATEDEGNEVERPANPEMISNVEGASEEESFGPSKTRRQQVVPSPLPISFNDALNFWSDTNPDLDEGMINRFRTRIRAIWGTEATAETSVNSVSSDEEAVGSDGLVEDEKDETENEDSKELSPDRAIVRKFLMSHGWILTCSCFLRSTQNRY